MMNKVIVDQKLNAGLKKSTAGGTRQRNLNRHAEGLSTETTLHFYTVLYFKANIQCTKI
jgi:hypothetical protein